MKRLFLVAGYDKDGLVDDTLVYYVRNLSEFGDVVLFMDSDCDKKELAKINKYCRFACAKRHMEYDFGSYKRAYLWSKENLGLENYNFVYMVNDSVYGPFFDLGEYLKKMESFNTGAFGMVDKIGGHAPHIQSWFIGMKQTIFLSDWFDKFITSVERQISKNRVAIMYETGFSLLLKEHGERYSCLYHVFNRGVYKSIKSLYKKHMPFMKKVAFLALEGALGYEIRYVLNKIPKNLSIIIINNAKRVYGTEYANKVLSNGFFISIKTKIQHLIKRIKTGTI